MKRINKLLITPLVILFLTALSACGTLTLAVETPTAVPTTVQPPTDTPQPTATQTISPTATATQIPTATTTAAPISSEPVDIGTIHMVDEFNGWGIGKLIGGSSDMILTTQDGGQTWDNVTPPHVFDAIGPNNKSAIAYFMNNSQAWVIYFNSDQSPLGSTSAVVWETGDGGQTWTASQPLDIANLQMAFFKPSDIYFSDSQHGWIMVHLDAGMMHDYVAVFSTSDGGQTWKMVVDPSQNGTDTLPQSFYKNGMTFLNADTGWIAGDFAGTKPGVFFYKTTDGGKTWANQDLPAPASTPDALTSESDACSSYPPQFVDANTGYMLVKCTNLSGSTPTNTAWTYKTTDGGINWTPLPALPKGIGSMFFLNNTTGWFLGATSTDPTQAVYSISRTTDGGQTWTMLIQPNWNGSMDFISDQVGWITATSGTSQNLEKALVTTTDGGKSWKQLQPVVILH